VLSGRGLCDELITHPGESYRLWCVVVCDLETSRMRRPWPALGRSTTGNKQTVFGGRDRSAWYLATNVLEESFSSVLRYNNQTIPPREGNYLQGSVTSHNVRQNNSVLILKKRNQ
jgi:hypothetical protein